MAERRMAVVDDATGSVINVIVFDDDSGDYQPLEGQSVYEDKAGQVDIGWSRSGNNRFVRPPAPELPPVVAEEMRLRELVSSGEATQEDKDALLAILLR